MGTRWEELPNKMEAKVASALIDRFKAMEIIRPAIQALRQIPTPSILRALSLDALRYSCTKALITAHGFTAGI